MNIISKKILKKRYVLPAVIAAQFIAIGFLAVSLANLKRQVYQLDTGNFGRLVIDAADGLNRDLKVDPQTGKAYIHEARLMLPSTDDPLIKLRYRYVPTSEGAASELRIIDEVAVQPERAKIVAAQNIDSVFLAVPKFQSCTRGYLISFEEIKDSDGREVMMKPLSDGRVMYAYLEDSCIDNSDKVLAYLQQIDSY